MARVKGGSLGFSVLLARYRQWVLAGSIGLLLVLLALQYIWDDPIVQVASWGGAVLLAGLMLWRYAMDGYAIRQLGIKEKKLFGNKKSSK